MDVMLNLFQHLCGETLNRVQGDKTVVSSTNRDKYTIIKQSLNTISFPPKAGAYA